MAANMICASFSNRGVNLWAVDQQTILLVQGQSTYTVPLDTVTMLDAYMTIVNADGTTTDRLVLPISRSEYASYPNKQQQGFTTVYWFDRQIDPNPTVTLWPVPDGVSATYMNYYRVRQLQDAALSSAAQVEVPYLWLDAFAYALAARLALIWAPEKAAILKPLADEAYQVAAEQNIETANTYISPQLSSYWRP